MTLLGWYAIIILESRDNPPRLRLKGIKIMANRLQVASVQIARQIEAYTYIGCDGYPASAVFSPVGVEVKGGGMYFLPQGIRAIDDDGNLYYRPRYDTMAMMDKVARCGTIDPDHWVHVLPYDREAELEADYIREQDDRRQWGA